MYSFYVCFMDWPLNTNPKWINTHAHHVQTDKFSYWMSKWKRLRMVEWSMVINQPPSQSDIMLNHDLVSTKRKRNYQCCWFFAFITEFTVYCLLHADHILCILKNRFETIISDKCFDYPWMLFLLFKKIVNTCDPSWATGVTKF